MLSASFHKLGQIRATVTHGVRKSAGVDSGEAPPSLDRPERGHRLRRFVLALLLIVALLGFTGCKTVSFYAQAIKGQCHILTHKQDIAKLLSDPQTPAPLRERLQLLEDLRSFAERELQLPVNGHYRQYVDLHRPYVVWNVEAAPEFSMEPKSWRYPFVGRLEYRGYFSLSGATNYARGLRTKGYDVSVGGVQAYSTLGWFKDPVLNTFLFEPDTDLAEIIFHELGHQKVFASGDEDFNEAFATTVGQEGTRRWLRAKGHSAALEAYLAHLERNRLFVHLAMRTRARLEALYGDQRTASGRVRAGQPNPQVPPAQLRERKERILNEMKEEYARMKAQWGGGPEYDGWFTHPINNAHLNSVAAYYDLVPAFEQLLSADQGNLEKFYTDAKRLASRPKTERRQSLSALAQRNGD